VRQMTSAVPPRESIKAATKAPPTPPATGPSLGEKLEQRRAAEAQGIALRPFGVGVLASGAGARPVRATILEDDSEDEDVSTDGKAKDD